MNQEIKFNIFGVFVILFITSFYIYKYQKSVSSLESSFTPTNKGTVILSLGEISKHNNQKDCWIIIENKVYSVTDFLSIHPGGSDRIISYCGSDATQPFLTKGGKGSHSQKAFKQLDLLYLGDLNSQTNIQNIKKNIKHK
ncbi:MAG: cytochrome b5 domain-containing protein [Fervidobacterium sp.]